MTRTDAIPASASLVLPRTMLVTAPYHERNLDRSLFDNFTYIVGRHTLRTGFQFQQMLKTENGTNGSPTFNFNNTSSGAMGK